MLKAALFSLRWRKRLKLSYKKKYRAERPEINLFKKRINPAWSHRADTNLPINGSVAFTIMGTLWLILQAIEKMVGI